MASPANTTRAAHAQDEPCYTCDGKGWRYTDDSLKRRSTRQCERCGGHGTDRAARAQSEAER